MNSTYYKEINDDFNLINSTLINFNYDSKKETIEKIKYYFEEIIEFIFFDFKYLKNNKIEKNYFNSFNYQMIIILNQLNIISNSIIFNEIVFKINDLIFYSYKDFLIKLNQNQNDYNQNILKNFIDFNCKNLNQLFIYHDIFKDTKKAEDIKQLTVNIISHYNNKNYEINNKIINDSLFFIKNLDKFENKINDFYNDKNKIKEIFQYIEITLSELSKFTSSIEYIGCDLLNNYTKDFSKSLVMLKDKIQNNYFLFKDLKKIINNYNLIIICEDYKIIL